jgi:hypothetical protein
VASREQHGPFFGPLGSVRRRAQGLQGKDMTALGSSALQHQAAILCLHPSQKAMGLGATAVIGLESALHRPPLWPVPERMGGPLSLPAEFLRLKPKELSDTSNRVLD